MKKFGVRDQIGYAFGDVAGTAMTIMQSYFLVFCTYVLGISPGFMAGLFFVAKIWDAVNDPLIGQIPDHHLIGKSGDRFKPYVRLGIIPMALLIIFMYADVSTWNSIVKHIWVCFVHVGGKWLIPSAPCLTARCLLLLQLIRLKEQSCPVREPWAPRLWA